LFLYIYLYTHTHTNRKYRSVSSGRYHSCGILDDSTVQCWGASGASVQFNVGQVYPVPGKGRYKWREVSAGVFHTCGVTEKDVMHCWGCGAKDALGRPRGVSPWGEEVNKGQCNIPRDVGGWRSVSAGLHHTCGVTTNGTGLCWGCKCSPALCPAWNSTDVNFGQCDVPTGHLWSEIAVGMYHTCGLTTRGKIYCWGCTVDVSKQYHALGGGVIDLPKITRKRYNYGQCNVPQGVVEWMNAAAFGTEATWHADTYTLEVGSFLCVCV
jgi:hypothetical protein